MQTVERVACAIYTGLVPGAAVWDELPAGEQALYRAAARRAIAALRFPSDAMRAEGDRRDLPSDAGNVWERMVFSALGDVPHV